MKKSINSEKPVPRAERYASALAFLAGTMPQSHRELLLAHYRAPKHQITARELAEAVGYKNYQAVNLQYSKLADRVRELLDWHVGKVRIYIFATFIPPGRSNNPEWLFAMRPQVARALEELGWV